MQRRSFFGMVFGGLLWSVLLFRFRPIGAPLRMYSQGCTYLPAGMNGDWYQWGLYPDGADGWIRIR